MIGRLRPFLTGRLNRRGFWRHNNIGGACFFAGIVCLVVELALSDRDDGKAVPFGDLLLLPLLLGFLACALIQARAALLRAHDLGWNGIWFAAAAVLGWLGFALFALGYPVVGFALFAAWGVASIPLTLKVGEPSPNRFGAPPAGRDFNWFTDWRTESAPPKARPPAPSVDERLAQARAEIAEASDRLRHRTPQRPT